MLSTFIYCKHLRITREVMGFYISFVLKVLFSEEIGDIVLLEQTSEHKCFGEKRY